MVTFIKRPEKKAKPKKKVAQKVTKKSKSKNKTKTLETPVIKASTQKKFSGEVYEELAREQALPPYYVTDDMATVGVSIGATKNLGNFEALKIQVSLHMKCDESEVDKKVEFIAKKVDKYLDKIGKDQGL